MSSDKKGIPYKSNSCVVLANVNSCSCSLYMSSSVRLSSVVCRLSSVSFVHPTQPVEIFGNVSTPFGKLAICDPSKKFYGDRPRGIPPSRGCTEEE